MPWYAVSLSYLGEKEPFSEIEKSVKRLVGESSEIFSPRIQGKGSEYKISITLIEGYIFVMPGNGVEALMLVENDPLFTSVISVEDLSGNRIPTEISQGRIDEMRLQLREMGNPDHIEVGDSVLVVDGMYRCMYGVVRSIVGDMAKVEIQLHSKVYSPDIPLYCLSKTIAKRPKEPTCGE